MPTSNSLSSGEPKTELTKPESDLNLIISWQGATIDIPIEEIPTTGKITTRECAREFMLNVKKWMEQTGTSWSVLADFSEVAPDTMRKVLKLEKSMTYRLMQKMAICILDNWDGFSGGGSRLRLHATAREPRSYLILSSEEILRRREAAQREIIERERYWLKQERIRWGVPKSNQISIWEMAV